MELEILKLVFDYSRNGKLADNKFIDKIVEIVVKNRDLHEYVRNIRFVAGINGDANGLALASYNISDKNIKVYNDALQFYASDSRFCGYYAPLFNGFEEIMFKNLAITQIILHELEHALQKKRFDNENGNPIVLKLINASFVLESIMKNPENVTGILSGAISLQDLENVMLQTRKLYEEYYRLVPTERFAEINSFRTISKVLEPIGKQASNLYEFHSASLYESMLSGYKDSMKRGICPTQAYLDGTGQGKVWTRFDFYDENVPQLMKNVNAQYDLAQRLALGLPISYDEFYETEDWLRGTNKFNV